MLMRLAPLIARIRSMRPTSQIAGDVLDKGNTHCGQPANLRHTVGRRGHIISQAVIHLSAGFPLAVLSLQSGQLLQFPWDGSLGGGGRLYPAHTQTSSCNLQRGRRHKTLVPPATHAFAQTHTHRNFHTASKSAMQLGGTGHTRQTRGTLNEGWGGGHQQRTRRSQFYPGSDGGRVPASLSSACARISC